METRDVHAFEKTAVCLFVCRVVAPVWFDHKNLRGRRILLACFVLVRLGLSHLRFTPEQLCEKNESGSGTERHVAEPLPSAFPFAASSSADAIATAQLGSTWLHATGSPSLAAHGTRKPDGRGLCSFSAPALAFSPPLC